MTHIEQAIKEAVEKGEYTFFGKTKKKSFRVEYSHDGAVCHWEDTPTQKGFFPSQHVKHFSLGSILLDPLFWQAYYRAKSPTPDEATIRRAAEQANIELIQHIHNGKDAESFFKDL